VRFLDPDSLRPAADALFARERAGIARVLPAADVQQIGATSMPGAWSKGDVDLLVRVDPSAFAPAVDALRRLYREHQRENWNATFASFASEDEPVGAQLVVIGSDDDRAFRGFRDALRDDPALLEEYNALKRAHDGAAEDVYRAAKAAFVRRVLGSRGS
jgi:GrpB-like predicted nucleotidyltransferase (UPF0157 family)